MSIARDREKRRERERDSLWEKLESDSPSRASLFQPSPSRPFLPKPTVSFSASARPFCTQSAECLDVQFVIPVELIGGELALAEELPLHNL